MHHSDIGTKMAASMQRVSTNLVRSISSVTQCLRILNTPNTTSMFSKLQINIQSKYLLVMIQILEEMRKFLIIAYGFDRWDTSILFKHPHFQQHYWIAKYMPCAQLLPTISQTLRSMGRRNMLSASLSWPEISGVSTWRVWAPRTTLSRSFW